MECGEKRGEYVWQAPGWPVWRYDLEPLVAPLSAALHASGRLVGRLAEAGVTLRDTTHLDALTEDVVQTSAIEGERLSPGSVRSSLARRLGVEIGALAPTDRAVEGVVAMTLDATGRAADTLTLERLLGWHAALFPTGHSDLVPLRAGALRDDAHGPMRVVSGPHTRPRVQYEAPPAPRLAVEMARFLAWADARTPEPPLIKAGLAHLWFVTLHPFDDGNGRVARALGDLFLARAQGGGPRFYSLSAQIQRERGAYYAILERTQKRNDTLDATGWLVWFLSALGRAVAHAESTLDGTLARSRFWQARRDAEARGAAPFNARQVKMLNRLFDGFDGRLTTGRWARVAKCSTDTALRDIGDLLDRGVLRRLPGGGRSTAYALGGERPAPP